MGGQLSASKVVIQGQFLYSKQEAYSYGIFQHPQLEAELPIWGEGESDETGKFEFSIDISEPQVLQLQRKADVYRLYVQPGDSLQVKILNRFNIEFAGGSREENELFFQMEFHQAFYAGDPLEDCLLAMDTLQANRQALLQAYQEQEGENQEDFISYVQAAMIGNRYDRLNRVYHRHVREQPENSLLAIISNELLELPVLNEVRSAAYLNAVLAFLENTLDREKAVDPILAEDKALLWERRRAIIADWVTAAPRLARHLDFSLLTMQLWWVENPADLDRFESQWATQKTQYPNDTLHTFLTDLHLDRRSGVLLQSLEDFSLLDTLGNQEKLSDLQRYPLLVVIWSDSTNIQGEIERFESLLPLFDKNQLVTVYLGEEQQKWIDQVAAFSDTALHFRMPEEEGRDFARKYEVHKYPIYVLFNNPMVVKQVAFELSQAFYSSLFSINRP